MERDSIIGKRLWNVLRITLFMVRKGLISKRKLMMDMDLMMKRGKLVRKSLSNLMSHHHHHHSQSKRGVARSGFGLQDYEFSCSNSPNPVFSYVHKRKHYFPCINAPKVIEEEDEEAGTGAVAAAPKKVNAAAVVLVPRTPEYTFNFRLDAAEKRSPLLSPFSVRVSNFSSELEEDDGGNGGVDDEAEEFIKRFYEQLRAQNRIQLLNY